MWRSRHEPVLRVVSIVVCVWADGSGLKTVVICRIGVSSRPVSTWGDVTHFAEVSYFVVIVFLRVVAPRHWIALAVLPEKRLIVPVVELAENCDGCIFSAGSFDQTIKRVVNIRGDAVDLLVVEKDDGYVSIFRVSDVTDGVERVAQILKRIIVRSFCFETD